MRKAKQPAAVLLSLSLGMGVIAGCAPNETAPKASSESGSEPKYFSEIGFKKEGEKIVDNKINVSVFGLTHAKLLGGKEDWEKNLFWKRLEDKTNIHFDFKKVVNLGDSWREQMNLSFASGDQPDIFFKAAFTKMDEMQYGASGAIIPLENLIKSYMPNLSKLLQTEPQIRKDITTPDGHIYTLPEIILNKSQRVQQNLIINQLWLEKLDLKEPTTVDELYTVLKAFKTKDPNGNKQPDEIPMSIAGVSNILGLMQMFGYMYGENGMFEDPDKKKVLFVPSLPEFKELLVYMKKLYAEGLMDPEAFTQTKDQEVAKGSSEFPRLGTFISNNPDLIAGGLSQKYPKGDLKIEEQTRKMDYKFLTPIKSTNGRQFAIGKPLALTGKFAITNKAQYPEAIARWIDYLYSEEGGMYYWAGVAGQEYKLDGDNMFWLNGKGEVASAQEVNDIRKRGTMQPGGSNPSLFPEDFNKLEKTLINTRKPLGPYVRQPIPSFFFDTADQKRANSIAADINPYIEQFTANVIIGKLDIDKEWDNFQTTLKRMGSDDLLGIYQKSYEAYNKN